MTQIIAFSGRKGSGKSTCAAFLSAIIARSTGLFQNPIKVTSDGKIEIGDLLGDIDYAGVFDIYRRNQMMDALKERYIHPFVKIYSFADKLKEIAADLLDLNEEDFYTEEGKNKETHLRWENMPGVVTPSKVDGFFEPYGIISHKPGPMTNRDVLQYLGTNIFRKMYPNIWVNATIKTIEVENSQLAIICDCRFPNEVEGVQKAGGKVIRLTRNPYPDDKHESETILDPENFDWNKFDKVIDNDNMDIDEQNVTMKKILIEWGIWPDFIRESPNQTLD